MELKRQKQTQIQQLREETLFTDRDLSLNLSAKQGISAFASLYQDRQLIKTIAQPDLKHISYAKALAFSDNQFTKNQMDPHDQAFRYYQSYKEETDPHSSDEQDDDGVKEQEDASHTKAFRALDAYKTKRRKVGDKEILSLSKEQAFDSSVPYDLLKSVIEEDSKHGKLVKHRGNTLCLNQINETDIYTLHPNVNKNSLQITKIELDRETKAIRNYTQVLSNENLMFNTITQLETFRQGNKIKIMSKDYFNVMLSEFDIGGESGVTALHEWGASECLIKFRQSPYVLEDFLVLSEKSIFYDIHLDQPQTELVPVFTFGVEQQGDYDFKQDFTYFDYGFHPKNILAGNFKSVYSIDLRSGKVSLLLQSKVHEEDLSFNKISAVRRVDNNFTFAVMEAEALFVYDYRAPSAPVFRVNHFLQEIQTFSDIVLPYCQGTQAFQYQSLEDLDPDYLSKISHYNSSQKKPDKALTFSCQNPSFVVATPLVLDYKSHKELDLSKQIQKLAGQEDTVFTGSRPNLVQTSSMHNHVSKVRGCQLLALTDSQSQDFSYIFSADNLGGLYVSVLGLEHHEKIKTCQAISTDDQIVQSVRQEASEDKMIAQVNFEEKYTFKELDCSEIVKDLVVPRQ